MANACEEIIRHLASGELPLTDDDDDMRTACFYVAAIEAQSRKTAKPVCFYLFDPDDPNERVYDVLDIHPAWVLRAVVLPRDGNFHVPINVIRTLDHMCTVSLPDVLGGKVTLTVYEAMLASLQCGTCDKRFKSRVNARCCEAAHVVGGAKVVKGRAKLVAKTWDCLEPSDRAAVVGPGATALAREILKTGGFKKGVAALVRAAACLPDDDGVPGVDVTQALHVASEGTYVLPGIAAARQMGVTFTFADQLALIAYVVGTRLMAMGYEMDLLGEFKGRDEKKKVDILERMVTDDRFFKSLCFVSGAWADCVDF